MIYKNCLILILVFSFSNIFSEELKFNTLDDYKSSNFKSIKWNMKVEDGYNSIKNGSYREAIDCFKEAIKRGCNYNKIYEDILLCYINSNSIYGANKFINEVNNAKNNDKIKDEIPNLYRVLIVGYYYSKINSDKDQQKHEYISDIIKYAKFKESDSEMLADIYFAENDLEKSYEFYEKTNLNKNDYTNKIADCYFDNGNYIKAEEFYKLANNKLTNDSKKLELLNLIKKANKFHSAEEETKTNSIYLAIRNNPYSLKKGELYQYKFQILSFSDYTAIDIAKWLSEKEIIGKIYFLNEKDYYYYFLNIDKFDPSELSVPYKYLIVEYTGVCELKLGTIPAFKLIFIDK